MRPKRGRGDIYGSGQIALPMRSVFLDLSSVRESHRFVFQSLIATGTAMSI
jgi:hypothetical protein